MAKGKLFREEKEEWQLKKVLYSIIYIAKEKHEKNPSRQKKRGKKINRSMKRERGGVAERYDSTMSFHRARRLYFGR